MTVIEAKVTSKGQVTLPVELRDRLGIEPGDRVVFVEQADGSFALRVRSGTLASLRGILRGKVKSPSDKEVRGWIDEARSRAVSGAKKRGR
ncbi:MAG: AbrB/MazE/SpoVT family DNA-binding domain-containing protein [Hyphomonadaceae bacterium]|nr:AbrB/MazE/SpoVT family DNA-binding domain-containing protein [Hyphomonadaceae bacterium]